MTCWRIVQKTALVAAAWLVALLAVGTLAAQTGAEPPAGRRVVLIVPRGADAARAQSILDAIRAQLGDLPVAAVVHEAGDVPAGLRERLDLAARACREHGAMGAFFVESEQADDLLLYLVEPEAKRALVRRVKKTAGAEAAGVEEMSLIVRSTVGALLEGREIGMEEGPELGTKPPPPEPAVRPPVRERPPPPPPPRPEATSRARLSAHYAGEAYAPEAPWVSGLGVAMAFSPDSTWSFGLGYVAVPPAEVETDTARVRVARHPIRAFVGYEVPAGPTRLAAELGFSAEYARRATTETAGNVLATDDSDHLALGVSPRVVLRLPVWDRASLAAAVGIDAFLNNSEYVADLPGRRETLLSPYRVRARADLGLSVDLW